MSNECVCVKCGIELNRIELSLSSLLTVMASHHDIHTDSNRHKHIGQVQWKTSSQLWSNSIIVLIEFRLFLLTDLILFPLLFGKLSFFFSLRIFYFFFIFQDWISPTFSVIIEWNHFVIIMSLTCNQFGSFQNIIILIF